jgi:hypothetical protein
VVIVGWNDATAQVSSVKDAKGNTYTLAIGPTQVSGAISTIGSVSQSIYYAYNIVAGGTNTVTVSFSPAAEYPDVRILEYSGIATTNPLDVTSGSFGAGIMCTSNRAVTSNTVDLLVAGNMVQALTNGPGANFTQRILSSPDADIAEDWVVTNAGSYAATAPTSFTGWWVMQLAAFRAANSPPPSPPDTTPPTVVIAAPTAGQTLTGTVNVTVNVNDAGSSVSSVQLVVDGIPTGQFVMTSPYTFSLNTAAFANGSHSLSASAWDFANNTGTASPVSVNFSNSSPGNPAQSGMWSSTISSGTTPLPMVSVHSALLPNGKILMSTGQEVGASAIVWDPATGLFDSVPVPANIFCNAMQQMSDGQILAVGGQAVPGAHTGLPAANLFNAANESWTVLTNMTYPRWYPTATMLSSGSVIVTSGETDCDECDETIQEIYNPSTNSWSQLSQAPFFFPYYPHVFQLPDGRVFVPADGEAPIVSEVLDLNALTWTAVGGSAVDGGTTVMYWPSKFLKLGKSVDPGVTPPSSVATAYVLDMTQATPAWQQVASMSFPRTYQNATSLPDGTVLVTGGGTTTDAVGISDAVLPAELWSPSTETWTTLASMSAPRLYHSEAILLPDARVMAYGGGQYNGYSESTDQFSAEFFAPPYLFNGPRPTITSAPSQLVYGQNFTVQFSPNAAQIASVSLIRFGTVTHAFNMGQRFIPLTISGSGAGSLTVIAPANSNLAPPGNYMLFIVNTNGVPSVASIVHF